MYPAVGTVSASVARDFYLTGGEQSRRGALRSRRNSGSLSRVIATAVAAADRVASKDTKQRSPQAEKRARLRRRHTEPPGTRFAAIHSRTFVHLRLILCAQESDVWTRPGSVKVSSSQPRLGHINSRLVCLVPSSRPLASMLRWVSKLSLWSRWTHGPSPEDDEQEAQRILRAKAGHGSQPSLQAATTKVTGIAVTTRRTQLNTFRDARLVVDGGTPVVRRWGTSFIPVTPGSHVVRCYYPMNFVSRGGDSSITIEVPDGHVVAIEYKAPFFAINAGTWTVT
jgi:hypothetical protein